MIAVLPSPTEHTIQANASNEAGTFASHCASVFQKTLFAALKASRCTSQAAQTQALSVGKWSSCIPIVSYQWTHSPSIELHFSAANVIAISSKLAPVASVNESSLKKVKRKSGRWHATNSFNRHWSGNEWLLLLLLQVVITMTSSIMSSAPSLLWQPFFLYLAG